MAPNIRARDIYEPIVGYKQTQRASGRAKVRLMNKINLLKKWKYTLTCSTVFLALTLTLSEAGMIWWSWLWICLLATVVLLVGTVLADKKAWGEEIEMLKMHNGIPKDLVEKITALRRNTLDSILNISKFGFDQTVREVHADTVGKETNLFDAYESSGKQILLTGEPGSGKTVLLNLIAEKISLSASEDCPLLLNVSTWDPDVYPNIEDWIINQICSPNADLGTNEMQVSTATKLIENGNFVLLLDGIDELDNRHRIDCILAINRFIKKLSTDEHIQKVIITCDKTEHKKLVESKSPILNRLQIFEIMPIPEEQIRKEIGQLVETDIRWKKILEQLETSDSKQLVEAFRSPLILSLAHEINSDPLTLLNLQTATAMRQYICRSKIDSVLVRKDLPERSESWIKHIVELLDSNNSTEFQYEDLAFTEFPKKLIKKIWLIFAGIFVLSGVTGFIIVESITGDFNAAAGLGICIGLISPIALRSSLYSLNRLAVPASIRSRKPSLKNFVLNLVKRLALSLVIGAIIARWLQLPWNTGLAIGLTMGLVLWIWTLMNEIALPLDIIAEPDRALSMSKKRALFQTSIGLFLGLTLVFAAELASKAATQYYTDIQVNLSFIRWLSLGLASGLTMAVVFGIASGGGYVIMQTLSRRALQKLEIMPQNPKMFFDWVTDQGLMHKNGASYKFRHEMIRQTVLDSPIDITEIIDLTEEYDNSPVTQINYVS